jgi:hypothetical protein
VKTVTPTQPGRTHTRTHAAPITARRRPLAQTRSTDGQTQPDAARHATAHPTEDGKFSAVVYVSRRIGCIGSVAFAFGRIGMAVLVGGLIDGGLCGPLTPLQRRRWARATIARVIRARKARRAWLTAIERARANFLDAAAVEAGASESKFYSLTALATRESLRSHPRVVEALHRAWSLVQAASRSEPAPTRRPESRASLSFAAYRTMYRKLCTRGSAEPSLRALCRALPQHNHTSTTALHSRWRASL